MPLRSEEADAAVGDVFATVFVLVSEMWITHRDTKDTSGYLQK